MIKVRIFDFHFLMVASTLISSSCLDKSPHFPEYLLCLPDLFVHKPILVFIQEDVIKELFLLIPVSNIFPIFVDKRSILVEEEVLMIFPCCYEMSMLFVYTSCEHRRCNRKTNYYDT